MWLCKKEEASAQVVILVRTSVVVCERQIVACVDQEVIGHSSVIVVMDDLKV